MEGTCREEGQGGPEERRGCEERGRRAAPDPPDAAGLHRDAAQAANARARRGPTAASLFGLEIS